MLLGVVVASGPDGCCTSGETWRVFARPATAGRVCRCAQARARPKVRAASSGERRAHGNDIFRLPLPRSPEILVLDSLLVAATLALAPAPATPSTDAHRAAMPTAVSEARFEERMVAILDEVRSREFMLCVWGLGMLPL